MSGEIVMRQRKVRISVEDAAHDLRRVRLDLQTGVEYVVTVDGAPMGRRLAHGEKPTAAARASLLTRLRTQAVRRAPRWSRDELYHR